MIEDYNILKLIGKGGFGKVFKAEYKKTGEVYALKRIEIDDIEKKRIRREIKALTMLRHPHIVSLYSSFDHNEFTYLVMDYIEGNTLYDLLNDKHSNVERRHYDQYFTHIIDGVGYLHRKGMIHRDIKPANILLDRKDKAYIADFGTVKFVENKLSSLTSKNVFIGTVRYASPEALEGKQDEITSLTDIYSIGVLMYETLAGFPLFYGTSGASLMVKIFKEKPDYPHKLNNAISKEMSLVCMKALEKKPEHRYQSCDELLDAFIEAKEVKNNKKTTSFLTLFSSRRSEINYKRISYKKLKKLADNGDAAAMNMLGILYEEGDEQINKSIQEALSYYEQAAELGNHDAMKNIGVLYEKGLGVKQDYMEAFSWYIKATEKGNTDAMYRLGIFCEKGLGVEQSFEKAVVWYQQAAKDEHRGAMANLGWLYQKGYGVERNYEKAYELYKLSARGKNHQAMKNLGDMFYAGWGIEKDYAEARYWYKSSMNKGNIEAICLLGHLYEYGYGGEKNYIKAVECYQKAADLNVVAGLYRLGRAYNYGRGVEKNYVEAERWYSKAAELGDPDAMRKLADVYLQYYGVSKRDHALEWCQKAAEMGNVKAMNRLGEIYEFDFEERGLFFLAREWYKSAAESGNKKAMKNLARMYMSGKGDLEKDYQEATRWYEYLRDLKDYDAVKELGKLYSKINATREQYEKLIESYEELASQGDKKVMAHLGEIYEKGIGGIAIDTAKAREWYRRAAQIPGKNKQGNIKDQKFPTQERGTDEYVDREKVLERMDQLLEQYRSKNKSVEEQVDSTVVGYSTDYEHPVLITAVQEEFYEKEDYEVWYVDLKVKANNGDDDAMFNLGLLYEEGLGIEQNYERAKEWYQRSAEKGNNGAMNSLARLYREGLGVKEDKEKAKEWHKKSKCIKPSWVDNN